MPRAPDASTTLATRQLLRLSVAGEDLLVPIDAVHEILEVGRLTRVPQSPPFLRGVMNLRGAVVPVVDLAARFGREVTTLQRRSAIVVVQAAGEDPADTLVTGLLVDAVFEVLEVPAQKLESVPSLGVAIPPVFVAGMVNLPSGYAALLSLEQVLAASELTALMGALPS